MQNAERRSQNAEEAEDKHSLYDCVMPDDRVDPVIEVYKAGVDRTLLRENLKLSHEQRLLNLMRLQALVDEARKAGNVLRRK